MQKLHSGPKGNKGKGQPQGQGQGKAKVNEKNTAKPKPNQKGKGKQRDISEDDDREFDLNEEDDMEEDDDMDDMDMDDLDDMEVGDLFWKMEVKNDGEHTVEPPDYFDGLICVTQASFGEEVNNNSRTIVCCTTPYSSEPTPICVLTAGSHETQTLNLKFGSVAQVSLKGRNPSTVYLTGYLQPESEDLHDFPGDDEDMDIPEEFSARSKYRQETDDLEPASKKRKVEVGNTKKAVETKKPQQQQQTKQTAPTTQSASNKTDESPQKASGQTGQISKSQQKKLRKQQQQQQKSDASNGNKDDNKENTNTNEKPKEENKPKDDEKKANETATTTEKANDTAEKSANGTEQTTAETKEEDKPKSPKKQPQTPSEKTLPNGITIKDIKVGTGPDIKPGQLLSIFYAGQLEDKTVFDKNLTGSGFPYKFGSEDAIKGWHLGMKGMKIGGKRRLVIPPKFAYGAEGSAEKKVPANQTLTYTVEILESSQKTN